jgi:Fe-S-cluster containining protein
LPLTDRDLERIVRRTGHSAGELVRFVSRYDIDMDDEPEAFARLRQGKRVMVLGHRRGACQFLGADGRCTIYSFRPLGCRIFPFDPKFSETGALKRLRLIQATECRYALDGKNQVASIRELHTRHQRETARYHARIADWNRLQNQRLRAGHAAQHASEFLVFLGFEAKVSVQSSSAYQALQP